MHTFKVKNAESNTLKEHSIFNKIEMICTIAFTLEFFLRIIATPDKKGFFKSLLNTIDVVSVMPFYFTSILAVSFPQTNIDNIFVLSVFKVLRIFRLVFFFLKLSSLEEHLGSIEKVIGSNPVYSASCYAILVL